MTELTPQDPAEEPNNTPAVHQASLNHSEEATPATPETQQPTPPAEDNMTQDPPAPPPEHPADPITPDPGADLPGYTLSQADTLLDFVYGDHPHSNDGCHLDGGISSDSVWQRRWKRMVQIAPTHYDAPKGKVGRRFIATLAREFQGIRSRSWNSERPLVFVSVILQKTPGVRRAKDIRRRLTNRMDLWERGFYATLVDDTEAEVNNKPVARRLPDDETKARAFNARVCSGRIRAAVRTITRREGGGVLEPDAKCTKTGKPVIDVLRSKHPAMREPKAEDIGTRVFEPYDALPQQIPLDITIDVVEAVASKISGAAGPGGTDAVALQSWLLRFGAESERLRAEMADLTLWLSNSHPPYAAYRALMACRLVALDKQPGVRPVGIGEIYRRLIAKCAISVIGHQATTACGNLNLCAGLPAGIEGAVHAVRQAWKAPLPPLPPELDPHAAPPAMARPADPTIQDFFTQPPEPPIPDPGAALMVDAINGFNELGRKGGLWTVRHRWPGGSRLAFNCYRHSAQLILRRRGQDCLIILSQEGVTQGDPLSMIIYGVALTPLSEQLRRDVPGVLQPWYADDMAMVGPASGIASCMALLEANGPARGYFPEPSKSILICRPADQDAARMNLSDFDFQYRDGHRYVGGFIGTNEARTQWLEPMIADWVFGIKQLAKAAQRFPQAAYAGLAKSLQMEWQYLQRVLPHAGTSFLPIEEALAESFLPQLLQEPVASAATLRDLMALPVRHAGLGIPDPVTAAQPCHEASVLCTTVLIRSLRTRQDLDVQAHAEQSARHRRRLSKKRTTDDAATLQRLCGQAAPFDARRMRRSTETGAWLTAMPNSLNGTELSEDEFRDSLRLRFGLTPVALPERCDGCDAKFTVAHALSCKKGGLVLLRHNDIAAEWHSLCASALTASAVSDEPLILTGRDSQGSTGASTEVPPDLRGDIAAHGFWRRGTTAIFDVRVTDTDAPSNKGVDPTKILKRHEKEKRDKYLDLCLARRRHFTPLVFSVDGLRGGEAQAASKRLASRLATKWGRTYSEVCGFVRSRLSVALARSTSQCLRGTRDPSSRTASYQWETGAGLGLYR
jgi:hypothetical protein